MNEGILIVISGFSGAGKGTLMKRLISDYDSYALSVSMTTRKPREGEVNGVDYFYVSREEFEQAIADDKLIEYAKYCDNYYGTPKAYVDEKLKEGKNVILEIEVQGAMQIKKKFPDTLLLFVTPPTAAELERRLKARGTETLEVIEARMKRAMEEAESMDFYEYLVINDDLDICVKEMDSIISAAKFAASRRKHTISSIKSELQELCTK